MFQGKDKKPDPLNQEKRLQGRRVLVTGATGFAGSHVTDALLAAGAQVRVMVRATSNLRWIPQNNVEIVTVDLRDDESLEALVSDVSDLYHFGALTRALSPEEFNSVNTRGTIRLASAWQRQAPGDGRFLFCSSLAASGPAPSLEAPRTEADPPAPTSPYGRSKREAEKWLFEQLADRALILRPPAVYGPRDDAILSFFKWISRGWMPLPTPTQSRVSLIHVRDLVATCLALVSASARGIYHVDDGTTYCWEDIGSAIARALECRPRVLRIPALVLRSIGFWGDLQGTLSGRPPIINSDKARDILQPYWISNSHKARNFTGLGNVSLEEGMKETADWYIEHGWLG